MKMDATSRTQPENLEQLLDKIAAAAKDQQDVSLHSVIDAFGRKSFAPLLLLAGLITLAPVIGDIPGMPTLMAVLVLLTSGQLLFQRKHLWLPQWLLKRSISHAKLEKGLRWMRRPARFVDRFLKSRMTFFTGGICGYLIALTCLLIALAMPAMEVIPFSANGAGLALTIFGLSLIANDGLLALIGLLVTGATVGFVIYGLL